MIEKGKNIEKINERLVMLEREIERSGMIGLTNIHKHCEDLVKGILNITYGYQLKNLNEHSATFPGLDLGDVDRSVAFQVSSDKTSSKVNETLKKAVRFRYYDKFSKIRFLVLGKKQNAYTIDEEAASFFTFDRKTDLLDFDDVLKAIQGLDSGKVRQVATLVEEELPYVISELKGEQDFDGLYENRLINVEASMDRLRCTYFSHSVAQIRMNGLSATLPKVLETFLVARQASDFSWWLRLLDDKYRVSADAQAVIYHYPATDVGGQYKEMVLKVQRGLVQFEYAQYKDKDELMTDLAEELLSVIVFIFLSKRLYGFRAVQLEVEFDLSSNGRLIFMRNDALISVKPLSAIYTLSPSPLVATTVIMDTNNDSFLRFFEQVIGGFVTNEKGGNVSSPFMAMDEQRQMLWLDIVRRKWSLTLKELD